MTRELRQRHRRVTLALAILVTVVFIVGLMVRRPVPVMSGSTSLLDAGLSQPASR